MERQKRRWTCRETRSLLDDYLEGNVSGKTLEGLKSHLRVCAGCGQTFSLAVRLAVAGKSDTGADPGPGYWDRFLPRIEARIRENQTASGGRRILVWAPAGVVVLIALIGLGIWWNARRSPGSGLEDRLDALLRSSAGDGDLEELLEDLLPDRRGWTDPGIPALTAGGETWAMAGNGETRLNDFFAFEPDAVFGPRIDLDPEETRMLIEDLRSSPELRERGEES